MWTPRLVTKLTMSSILTELSRLSMQKIDLASADLAWICLAALRFHLTPFDKPVESWFLPIITGFELAGLVVAVAALDRCFDLSWNETAEPSTTPCRCWYNCSLRFFFILPTRVKSPLVPSYDCWGFYAARLDTAAVLSAQLKPAGWELLSAEWFYVVDITRVLLIDLRFLVAATELVSEMITPVVFARRIPWADSVEGSPDAHNERTLPNSCDMADNALLILYSMVSMWSTKNFMSSSNNLLEGMLLGLSVKKLRQATE